MSLNSRARLVASLSILAAAGLAGCTEWGQPEVFQPVPKMRTERFANQVALQPQGLLFAPNGPALSGQQIDALRQLAADWRAGGTGSVLVEIPGGVEAARTADGVAHVLYDLGLSPQDVRATAYDPSSAGNSGVEKASGGRAPVKISFFSRYTAVPEVCGQKWDSLTATFHNAPYYNFGCAVNANAAVQTAEARDLAGPRPAAPADAARRQVVLDKYRAGDITSSAKDEQASGAISAVAKQ